MWTEERVGFEIRNGRVYAEVWASVWVEPDGTRYIYGVREDGKAIIRRPA